MLVCRGCLVPLTESTLYSFSWPMVKELFTKCTYLEVPEDSYPQQICQACYTKCRDWSTFRTLCLESDERLRNDTAFSAGLGLTIKAEMPDPTEDSDDGDDGELEAGELLPTMDLFDDIPDPPLAQPKSRNRFQCPTCGKGLPSDWKLRRHMNVHKRVLKAGSNHIRRIRPRSYRCEECGKAFESNYKLNRHAAIHTREPKDKPSSTIHTQDPPDLACLVCGEAFRDAIKFQKHTLTHNNVIGAQELSDQLSTFLDNQQNGDADTPDLMCVSVTGGLADGDDSEEEDWTALRPKREPEEEEDDDEDEEEQDDEEAESPGIVKTRKKFNPKFKGKYLCKICDKACTSNWKLSRHMNVHAREDKYPPSLVEFLEVSLGEEPGGEGTSTSDDPQAEPQPKAKECAARTKDGKVAKHWCRVCRKVFPSKWKLNRHLNVHKREGVV